MNFKPWKSKDASLSSYYWPKTTLRTFWGDLQAFDVGHWSSHLGECMRPKLKFSGLSAAVGTHTAVVLLG